MACPESSIDGCAPLSFDTASEDPMLDAASMLRRRGKAVLGIALLFVAAALISGNDFLRLTSLLVASVLGGSLLWAWRPSRSAGLASRPAGEGAASFFAHDPIPTILAEADGRIRYANPAARRQFDVGAGGRVKELLEGAIDAGAQLQAEMRDEALARGAARRLQPRDGGQWRVEVHRTADDRLLWRLEALPAQTLPPPEFGLPLLTLDEDDKVLAANAAAQEFLGCFPKCLSEILIGTPMRWNELNDIRTTGGPRRCLALSVPSAAERHRLLLLLRGALGGFDDEDGLALFDALPVPLLTVSADGEILLSNGSARTLLDIESVEGLRISDLLEGPGRMITDWLDDALAGRGTVQPEILAVRNANREIFVQVTLRPLPGAKDPVLVAVLSDATKLKTLEAQFVQSQKMQAIGQLAGGVAHDFNNLLTAISGHCDLLLTRHDPEDADYPDLVQISQNANRAAALVSQLLAYSRKQTMQPETLDLRDMLSELTHLLNRLIGERITLTLEHDPALWPVRADKRQLEQVIMNLVVNARDAMPEGGEIRITTSNRRLEAPIERDRATVAAGRYVEVSVEDEGAGMSKATLEKIFDPFFTTKRPGEGTGLGLSTAYGIVKQTGGFIFADSTPQEGTRFRLLFPAHDKPATESHAPPAPTMRKERKAGVVLLVEDEVPVRAFATRALQMKGFSVIEAGTGEEALEILSDEALQVDVIVTDVILPGLDGPGWVQRALRIRPGTRVVFVSGYAADSFEVQKREIPNSVFIPKPFSLTELTNTVHDCLSE